MVIVFIVYIAAFSWYDTAMFYHVPSCPLDRYTLDTCHVFCSNYAMLVVAVLQSKKADYVSAHAMLYESSGGVHEQHGS